MPARCHSFFFSSPKTKGRFILNPLGFNTLGKIPVLNAGTLTYQVPTSYMPEKVYHIIRNKY